MSTKIPYAQETINPFFGCSKVSEGCLHCYAEQMAFRCTQMDPHSKYKGVIGPDKKWNGEIGFDYASMTKPFSWKKGKVIFVCSMGDVFHETIKMLYLTRLFDLFEKCPQHWFLLVTKRPEVALRMSNSLAFKDYFELPNIMIIVTAENQQRFNERIPILLQIPHVKKGVSIEPMLGCIDTIIDIDPLNWGGYTRRNTLTGMLSNPIRDSYCATPVSKLDWVIAGCESGNPHREMDEDWIRSLRFQCKNSEVPFYFKQKYIGRKKIQNPLLDGEALQEYPEFLLKTFKNQENAI